MVIKDILSYSVDYLKINNIENAIFEANLILKYFTNLSSIDLILKKNEEIDENTIDKIKSALQRRIKDEPIQYILNSQEFMGLEFYVDKNVLIPRQDTETLVEHVLEYFHNKSFSVLDIGTGSGCIAISLAYFNKKSLVRGIDISAEAVKIATRNAKTNHVDDRVVFEVSDIFSYNCFGKYDLIVSNPPYIETNVINNLDNNVKNYEPYEALDGGIDGLDYYRYITSLSPKILNSSGILAFEVGFNQAEYVKGLMEKDFTNIKIVKDLCGEERVVSGILK